MGISTTALPSDSPVIAMSFQVAVALVNQQLCVAGPPIYELAVYNLAGDRLINFAPDTPPSTFFADLRKSFNVGPFVAGVISASADEGTSESILNPEVMKNLTFLDLQTLKTPYGRTYLGFAQGVGTMWGLT